MLRWIKEWRSRERQENDLKEEIRSHLEIEKAEQVASGSSSQEAEDSARLAFGNMLKTEEDVRETWRWTSLERLWQDVRFGVRTLRKTPVWTFVIGTTLAFGIGAATAIFSLVYSVLLQPLPYPDADRIVALWPTALKNGGDRFRVSAALFKYWQENLTLVQDIGLTRPVANFNLTGIGPPERLQGARTTFNVPLTLRVAPLLGRYFTKEEQLTDAKVAVLSHGFWVRRFGADASVVGRKIQLNGEPFEVLGIMPRDYSYPDANFELWTPLFIPAAEVRHGMNHQYLAIGRLRPGATVAQAHAEIATIAGRLAREYPGSYKAGDQWAGALVEPLAESQSFSVRRTLLALMAAAGCLLLIGCINLAVLLMARANARSREMAMRIALGAGARRLRRQLVAEALPLGAVGSVGGLLLAWVLIRTLPVWLPPDLPRVETLGLHPAVLAFAIACSIGVVILASLLPARIASRAGLNEVLKQGSRSVSHKMGAREPLVIAQIAIAIVLVFSAVLFGRSLTALLLVSPGFEAEGTLTMHLAVTRAKYPADNQVADYYERIVESVKSVPGVIEAGIVNRLPLSGVTQNGGIEFEGIDGSFSADWRIATPGYFKAIGIPLKQGRWFSRTDNPAGAACRHHR